MRTRFDLEEFEPFTFVAGGKRYAFSDLTPLARKERLATLVQEYVYKLPDQSYVYLTVVGDDDQYMSNGIARGWYVAEPMTEADALWLIGALEPFTALYR